MESSGALESGTIGVQTVQEVEPVEEVSVSSSDQAFSIHTSPSLTSHINLDLQEVVRLNSANEQRLLDCLSHPAQPPDLSASLLDRQICMEEVCLAGSREQGGHDGHRMMGFSEVMGELQALRCNLAHSVGNREKVIRLLDDLDNIYDQILSFEDELTRLFHRIKHDALAHITAVKRSFDSTHYERTRARLQTNFTHDNVAHALAEVARFKLIQYDDLEYPRWKVAEMKEHVSRANISNKLIAVTAVNEWIDRLYGLNKKDRRVIYSRSIASFLDKAPSQKPLFSHYLKAAEYAVTHSGRTLTRTAALNHRVPFAALEKEMLPGTCIKFKVAQLGKGMFIGISTLEAIEGRRLNTLTGARRTPFENLVQEEGSYYLTFRGDVLSADTERRRHAARLEFGSGDEIWLRREANEIIWRRKRDEKEARVSLSITEYRHAFYPCVHFEDARGELHLPAA